MWNSLLKSDVSGSHYDARFVLRLSASLLEAGTDVRFGDHNIYEIFLNFTVTYLSKPIVSSIS